MAITTKSIWEIRSDGDDDNGGGYVVADPGTDYTQQAAAQLTVADAATSGIGVTTVTSATGGFTAAMVGNVVHLYGGGATNLTSGWYEIKTYTDTNTISVDRAPDDGVGGVSGASAKVGGALASPGGLLALNNDAAATQTAWIKAGTYVLTTASENVSGGIIHLVTGGTIASALTLRGYQTTRGDRGTRPIVQVPGDTSVENVIVIDWDGNSRTTCDNVAVDGNDQVGITGFQDGSRDTITYCEAYGCVNGFNCLNTHLVGCYAHDNSGYGISARSAHNCVAKGNTGRGFDNTAMCNTCLSIGNSEGFEGGANSNSSNWVRCTAEDNTGDGFNITTGGYAVSCLATNNGAYGFNGGGALQGQGTIGCFGYNNTSGNNRAGNFVDDFTDLTGDPYTNLAGGDLTPNNTAGAGAELRGADYGLPTFSSEANIDANAFQHADPAGGGGGIKLAGRGGLAG